MNTQALQRITTPQHRKGDTEERIYADNKRAKTTARLMAELHSAASLQPSEKAREGMNK